MADTSATIIAASLSSEELEKSINKLVGNVATATELIRKDFDDTVNHIKKQLSTLGDIKFNIGNNTGGSTNKSAGFKQVEQEAKSATVSIDNFVKAQQVAVRTSSEKYRNADMLETMKIQLELLRQRLIETRQQYSSFVALAANAVKTGDEGLYKFATSNVHAYETEAKSLVQQIRGVQNAILQMGDVIAPQGHLIQNWVASIGKVSPELKQLGEQIKNNSLLKQQESRVVKSTTDQEVAETKRRIESEIATAKATSASEASKRRELQATAVAATTASKEIIKAMFDQASSSSKEPIRGIQELHAEIVKMRRAYFDLSLSDRESPYGQALKRDIKMAQDAITAVQKYNREFSGIKFIGKDTIGNNLRSYSELQNVLHRITEEYKFLGKTERDAAKGTELLNKIQSFQREVRDVQRTMARPTSLKKALGLDESTLDHINDKLQALRAYKGGLKITDPKQLEEMKQVDMEINKLQKVYDKLMAKNSQMIASNNALGRSWNYMKNRLAFYFSVGASTQFIKNLIEVRSQYEMNERALGILIGSAERGTQIFNELSQMALVSPYTLIELSAAAKQLTAYDVAARDVVDTTRRLADMAAAVGIPIERLTYALGQIKAYGYLNARDARMFANAGIPLVKELADRYTELEGRLVSTSDVYDRIKKKAISYEDVMETVNKMTDEGGKFFNFQEKAADTLKVKIANLTLAWNNMLNEIGKDNQGVLAGMLNLTKQIFESWRDINNMLVAIAVNFGVIKAIQISRLLLLQKEITWTRTLVILQNTLGKGAMNFAALLGKGVTALANPITLAIAAATALSIVITKLTFDYSDLRKANDAFNKSIVDSAEENIKSIDKFFEDYKKQLEGIGGASTIDQQKMWEKIQDEIEKTTKNAQQYIVELEKIQNVADRIDVGKKILEQEQEIEQEAKRLAEKGIFDLGGGFADDSLADNLISYEKELKNIRNEYGNVTVAVQEHSLKSRKMMADYTTQLQESERELSNFTSKLDEADITKIMGDDPSTQLANLREFTNIIRDNFLATERGQKITVDGQARLNSSLDKWVAKQAQANELIKNQTVYSIEENRTAWETFFDQLNRKDRERLDYLIKTNQTGSDDFKEIWDKATKSMAERATTSYELIQSQIANLRNTPDIVINVVYKERTQKVTDKQIQAYKEKYLTPDNSYTKEGIVGADVYAQEQERLTRKYGRYIKKEGEDNVDWEKRLGQEYQNNTKNIKSLSDQIDNLNKQKEKGVKISEVDIQAKKDEKSALEENNKTLLEIGKNEGFNYEQFEKGRKGGSSKKDLVLEALKQEISLVERLQGDYDKLTKSGASRDEALKTIRDSFGKTINSLNAKLSSAGLPELTTQLFIGKDPNKMLEHFKQTLNTLVSKGMMTLERSKEIEAVIEKLTVSAKTYNLDKITKGLNNELGRLKDEYELAVSLDADPELGNMFADWMGIDVSDLPRTASEYAERASKILNDKLKDLGAKTELPSVLDITDDEMRAFEENKVFTDKQLELVKKAVDAARGFYKKEVDDRIKDWDKLLEKYAEYETKINKIQNDAVKERVTFAQKFGSEGDKSMALNLQTQILAATDPQEKQRLIQQLQELVLRIAGDDKTKINLVTAIKNSEQQGVAKASFEEFQKSPEWITATGDIASLTTSALNTLINSLEEYKKKAKNLDPKQVEKINKALRTMHKEVRKDNPFSIVANAMEEAKARGDVFDAEISDIEQKIATISARISKQTSITGFANEDDIKTLEKYNKRLKELKDIQSGVTQISFKEVNEQINKYLGIASNVAGVLSQIASTIKDADMARSAELAGDIVGNMQAAGQGFASGGWIGAVSAGITDLVPKIFKWASMEADIDDSIKESERSVKHLELAYVDLQQAVDKAYGTATIGAKQATLANKELQLAEIQRQIQLEKSRSSKNRDEDKIIDLQRQYKELFYEIKNGYTEIVDELMGTDVASFAENLVSSMIDAFKQGEDYMKVFGEKFDEMIDNMIMKSIVSRVVSQYLNQIWDSIDQRINDRSQEERNEYGKAQSYAEKVRGMSDEELKKEIAMQRTDNWSDFIHTWDTLTDKDIEEYRKAVAAEEIAAKKRLDAASEFTGSDVDYIMEQITEVMPELGEKLKNILGEYYKFGESSDTQLSALQQGIQGVTETTAGALEAYMNGISQQVYLQSEYLRQIAEVMTRDDNPNDDIQIASLSQILLQLQNSYQTQEAIKTILQDVSSVGGNDYFKVKLID